MSDLRNEHDANEAMSAYRRNENQGRGPAPKQASGYDWLLAVVLGVCFAMVFVSWTEERDPNPTSVVQR